jgi:supervillin
VLAQLNRSEYSASILRQKPLPDGVNPLKLENYLSDQEFQVNLAFCFNLNERFYYFDYFKEILHTTKQQFAELPAWKQKNLKIKARLF